MTPDAYVNLTIVNATTQQLVIANNTAQYFNHSYQMNSWFPETPGTAIVSKAQTQVYSLQFLRGVGDEDDSADAVMAFSTNLAEQLFHFHAYSNDNSSHHFAYDIITLPSPIVICTDIQNGDWTQFSDYGSLKWYSQTGSNQNPIDLGAAPSAPGFLLLVDLQAVMGDDTYQTYYAAISDGTLTPGQSEMIYNQIKVFLKRIQAEQ